MNVTTKTYQLASENADRDARILDHLDYVRQICGALAVRLPDGVDLENLQSAGVVGLIEAAQNYDPARGVAFKTYAYPRIRGSIVDEIRRNSPLPQRVLKLISQVRAAIDQIEPPVMPEAIVEATGLTLGEIEEALEAMRVATVQRLDDSLDAQMGDTRQRTEDPVELEEMRQRLADGIEQLPDRERHILTMYYSDQLRLKEIGAVLDLSESRVSRILARAQFRLREICRAKTA